MKQQYSIEEVQGVTGVTCACGKRELLQRGDVRAFALTGRSGQLKKWVCDGCMSATARLAVKTRCLGVVQ